MKAVDSPPTPLAGAQVWPLTIAAYHALGEAGLIPKNTELLYGFVYRKMSKSPLRSFLVQFLHDALVRALPTGSILRTEQPITCVDSEPEPDLSVVMSRKEDYRPAHPRTAELVIAVCVSSPDYDRSKLRAYAGAGVKECWLVLAPEKQVEVYREPAGDQFAARVVVGPAEKLFSTAIPSFSVDVDTLFA